MDTITTELNLNSPTDRQRYLDDQEAARKKDYDQRIAAAGGHPGKIKKADEILAAKKVVDERQYKVDLKKIEVAAAQEVQKREPGVDNVNRVTTKKKELEVEEDLLEIDEEALAAAESESEAPEASDPQPGDPE